MEFSAKQIATFIQGGIVGDGNATVHIFAKIEEGIPEAISFLSNPKYIPYLYETQSSIVLVNKDFVPRQEVRATVTKVDNVCESFAKLLDLYERSKLRRTGIDSRAYATETAKMGKDVYIAPFACIGEYTEVGDDTVIHPYTTIGSGAKVDNGCIIYASVTIYHNRHIGSRYILHAGCIIGTGGFEFAPTPEGYEKISQIGVTILKDDVEIGADTCVDRATMGAIIVYSGVRLDNLVQVAHSDEIGSHTVMAAQVGMTGSTKVSGQYMFGGQVGIAGYVHIGNKVNLDAQSGVPNDIKEGSQSVGTPLMEVKSYFKSQSISRKLPNMYFEANALHEKFNELEKQSNK